MVVKKSNIYLITCLINDKKYIGRTVKPIYKRFNEHINESKYILNKKPLYSDIKKYGKENFSIELVKVVDFNNINELEMFELSEIEKYNCFYPNGYNKRKAKCQTVKNIII